MSDANNAKLAGDAAPEPNAVTDAMVTAYLDANTAY